MLGLSVLLCGCGGKSVEKEGTGTYTNDSGEKTTARVKLKMIRLPRSKSMKPPRERIRPKRAR